jgi:hypothetical protein
VNGDNASVTLVKEGLKTSTAVGPADTIWVAERGTGKVVLSIPNDKTRRNLYEIGDSGVAIDLGAGGGLGAGQCGRTATRG